MGKLKYRHTTVTSRLIKLCKEARSYHAYASWGMMQDWFRNPETAEVIAVAYDKDRVIGAAILMEDAHYNEPRFGVYVKRQYRRKGIGKKLTNIIKRRSEFDFEVDRTENNFKFFDSVDLY